MEINRIFGAFIIENIMKQVLSVLLCLLCSLTLQAQDLKSLFIALPDSLVIYSGHDYGEVPFRTLGEEKARNPYLRCATLEEFREQLKSLE